ITLAKLVSVLDAQYKDEEAESVLREYLSAWKKQDWTFPDGDTIISSRGFACLERGDYADAQRHFRQVLEVRQKSNKQLVDLTRALMRFQIGQALFLEGKTEEARSALRDLVPMAHLLANQSDHPLGSLPYCSATLLIAGSGQPDELRGALAIAER